jgi:hypothetical protein
VQWPELDLQRRAEFVLTRSAAFWVSIVRALQRTYSLNARVRFASSALTTSCSRGGCPSPENGQESIAVAAEGCEVERVSAVSWHSGFFFKSLPPYTKSVDEHAPPAQARFLSSSHSPRFSLISPRFSGRHIVHRTRLFHPQLDASTYTVTEDLKRPARALLPLPPALPLAQQCSPSRSSSLRRLSRCPHRLLLTCSPSLPLTSSLVKLPRARALSALTGRPPLLLLLPPQLLRALELSLLPLWPRCTYLPPCLAVPLLWRRCLLSQRGRVRRSSVSSPPFFSPFVFARAGARLARLPPPRQLSLCLPPSPLEPLLPSRAHLLSLPVSRSSRASATARGRRARRYLGSC